MRRAAPLLTLVLSACSLVWGIEGGEVREETGTGGTGGIAGSGGQPQGGNAQGGMAGGGGEGGQICDPGAYANLVLSHGPLGYWPFTSPPAGVDHVDATGNGHDFTQTEILEVVDGLIRCDAGSAVDFTDANEEMFMSMSNEQSNPFQFDGMADFTLEAWVAARDTTSGFMFYKVQGANAMRRGYQFGFSGPGELRFARFSDTIEPDDELIVPTPIPNVPHHLVAVYTGTTMLIYVDGELANSMAASISMPVSFNSLQIGRGFDGVIDEIAIYPRVLTPDEVSEHYDAGRAAR